jgi:DNA-binding transcriptional MerR regulator
MQLSHATGNHSGKPAPKSYYTSAEIAAAGKVTLRQIQNWDETGLLTPERFGHVRSLTIDDYVAMLIIVELREKHFSIQNIRQSLKKNKWDATKMGRAAIEALEGYETAWLLCVTGKRMEIFKSVVELLKFASNVQDAVRIVDLTRIVGTARADLK